MNITSIKNTKRIAFIVHPDLKGELIEWSYFKKDLLAQHDIIATGETANILQGTLNKHVTTYLTGALEGHAELNTLIQQGSVDAVIIFWSTNNTTPLQRNALATVIHAALEANIIIANNKTTADFIITSPLMADDNTEQLSKHYAA